jgi:hypothetical protein
LSVVTPDHATEGRNKWIETNGSERNAGIGLIQWTDPQRLTKLLNLNPEFGISILFDMDAQVKHLAEEIRSPMFNDERKKNGLSDTLKNSKTAENAAVIVLQRFARPQDSKSKLFERQQNAKEALDAYDRALKRR